MLLPYTAVSTPEAITYIKQKDDIELVILDAHLPEIDNLLQTASQHVSTQLPIILLSPAHQRNISYRNDRVAFVPKPIKPSQLLQAILSKFDVGKTPNTTQPVKPVFDETMGNKMPLRILLAEDNRINQKVAQRILGKLGYRIDIASNGAEAIVALQQQTYDVVFMDIQMPEMDGVEATKQIRQSFPVSLQPRIVAMTAHALVGDRENYLANGMDDYISKPVQLEELTKILHSAFDYVKRGAK
jgi:CheY-like chemotaxis protein